ncbi:unnamed protein product [Symbiodinium sp. KB8]|nr:unnamed protein product [Symbiodinium sp. KB8]
MSAQTFPAGVPNGTDSRGDGPVGGSSGAVETGEAGMQSSVIRGDEQLRDLNGSLAGLESSDLQGDGVGRVPPKSETVAATGDGTCGGAKSTTDDAGHRRAMWFGNRGADVCRAGAESTAEWKSSFDFTTRSTELCRYFAKVIVNVNAQLEGHSLDIGDTGASSSADGAELFYYLYRLKLQLFWIAGVKNMMKITTTGTLLMPFKGGKAGYSMVWTPDSCELISPDGLEALALIARLEDRKVEQLRNVHGYQRDVGFILAYPEGISKQERDRRDHEVEQMEAYAGVSTVNDEVSFWDTRLWKFFQREAQAQQISFGGHTINRTTLGTNIHSLLALDEVRVLEDEEMPERGEQNYIWSPGLVNAIVVAVGIWYQEGRCVPRVSAMTPAKWKQRVESNHAEYRRDCATCVMARGVGRQHRKVHHPESYTLTSDVAGPLNPGLDATSKGAMGKNLRYLLVAKYLVPKMFVENIAGKHPPDDHGVTRDKQGQAKPEDSIVSLPEGDLQTIEEFFKEHKDGKSREPEPISVGVLNMAGEDPFEEIEAEEEPSYEPSYEPPDVEDEDEDVQGGSDRIPDVLMQQGDCEAPAMTYLTFSTALPNNRSGTVRQAVQDIVLYLQMHGMPVYRFHSDTDEFYNRQFRSWSSDYNVPRGECTKAKKEGASNFKGWGITHRLVNVGWLNGLVEYKEVAQVLVRLMLEAMPEATFTSVMVSHNSQKGMHKDFNNDYQTSNYVLPLCMPEDGGDLWVELAAGDTVLGKIEKKSTGAQDVYGDALDWYKNGVKDDGDEDSSCSPWLMYLDLDPGCVQIPNETDGEDSPPMVCKTEVSFTHNIEGVLKALKEIQGIEVAIKRLPPGREAELMSMLDGAVATKGVEALLQDIGEQEDKRTSVFVDDYKGNIAVHVQLPPVLTPFREILDLLLREQPGGTAVWARLIAVAEALASLIEGNSLAHPSDVLAIQQGNTETALVCEENPVPDWYAAVETLRRLLREVHRWPQNMLPTVQEAATNLVRGIAAATPEAEQSGPGSWRPGDWWYQERHHGLGDTARSDPQRRGTRRPRSPTPPDSMSDSSHRRRRILAEHAHDHDL